MDHAGTRAPGRRAAAGPRLVAAGAALFGIGAIAAIAVVVPLLVDAHRLPVGAYLLTVLAPVGLGLALVGMVLGRPRSRATRRHPSGGSRPQTRGGS